MTRSKLPAGNGRCSASASSKRIETLCSTALRRLGEHRGREIDAGDAMTSGRQLEAQKAGAAAGVEALERAAAGQDQIEDAVPGGALGGRADAVAEVLVEGRRPPIPVGGDLLLDDVRPAGRHAASLPRGSGSASGAGATSNAFRMPVTMP